MVHTSVIGQRSLMMAPTTLLPGMGQDKTSTGRAEWGRVLGMRLGAQQMKGRGSLSAEPHRAAWRGSSALPRPEGGAWRRLVLQASAAASHDACRVGAPRTQAFA